jgi:hypothetical protein
LRDNAPAQAGQIGVSAGCGAAIEPLRPEG